MTAEGETPSTLYSTNTYGYNDADWGDLLTSFNGHTITYDAIGNPLNYYNGSSFSFTWKNGRQLATAAKGTYVLSYDYNDEGIRTKKVVKGVEHTYHLSGSQIVAEEWGSNLCVYLYDADGAPIGMQYRTTSMAKGDFYTFWFEKNLQGDIVAVYNESGTKVYTYQYDAWGNCTATPVSSIGANIYAQYNPFRYRGYYYDMETGLYYLQSRYYDPAIGRFINADAEISDVNGELQGYNLFTYCFNNPVNLSDLSGEWPSWATKLIIGTVCAVAAVAITVATAGTGAAAVVPALVAVGKTVAISTALGAGAGAVGHRIETGSWDGAGKAALEGAADGYMWGGIGAAGSATTNALQTMGKLPKRVKLSNLVDNPTDPYKTVGPKQGAVVEKISQIQRLGKYEYPSVKSIGRGLYEIQNGHHTVQALKSLGRKTVKVWLVK